MKKLILTLLFGLVAFQVDGQVIYPKPYEIKNQDFSCFVSVGKNVLTFEFLDRDFLARYKIERSQNLVDWSTVVYVDSFGGKARILILDDRGVGFFKVKKLFWVE